MYGGPEGPCQTHVYKFNIFKLIFSEPDVSNLEISKLDISKIFSYSFCTPVSMDSLDDKAVALAWGLIHAPTLVLNPGGPYMHWPMYCHSWAWPG